MEEKKLSEKESLALITEMINSAKKRLEKYSGLPFIISGYITLAMITASWFLLNQNHYWNLLLFTIPVFGFLSIPLTNALSSKEKASHLDRIINKTWLILAFGLFVTMVGGLPVWAFPMIFYKTVSYFLLFIGIGIIITGVVIRFRLFAFLGFISILASLVPFWLNFFEKTHYIVWFADILVILMMIIPGHVLHHKRNKNHV
jgi:hypothetical protein